MRLVGLPLILSLAALSGSSAVAATKFVPKANEGGVPEMRSFISKSADGTADTALSLGEWSGSAEVEVVDDEAFVKFTLRRILPGGSQSQQAGWTFVFRVKLTAPAGEYI